MSVSQDALINEFNQSRFFQRLTIVDGAWALLVLATTAYVWMTYGAEMGCVRAEHTRWHGHFTVLFWLVLETDAAVLLIVAVLSIISIWLYGTDLASPEKNFFLKYMLASQSAVMWMSALFVLATVSYFFGLVTGSEFSTKVGSSLTWCAAAMGLIGLMVRWRESYLIHVDVGHIPVSNLYEVFILFCLITALMYLYYEERTRNRQMGGFALLVISAAVGFILWYTFDRGAHEIQPLVPALQSYWMKIHVPANLSVTARSRYPQCWG